ncbi:hypothetical protein EV421DRAFT_2022467 [Armillaria borealis]|uniref:Uncharacterized protein n=1 Tax=Armillaria borealis TaxID=47425 RepID=A0AA39MHY0_9AGAR|nr:hypothetical protein EV421DRAFT_2022467 [Armillaria borealis]
MGSDIRLHVDLEKVMADARLSDFVKTHRPESMWYSNSWRRLNNAGTYSKPEVDFFNKVHQNPAFLAPMELVALLFSSVWVHLSCLINAIGAPREAPNTYLRANIKTDLRLDSFHFHLSDTHDICASENSEPPTIDQFRICLRTSAVVIRDLAFVLSDLPKASFIENPLVGVIQPYVLLAFEFVTYCWLFNADTTSKCGCRLFNCRPFLFRITTVTVLAAGDIDVDLAGFFGIIRPAKFWKALTCLDVLNSPGSCNIRAEGHPGLELKRVVAAWGMGQAGARAIESLTADAGCQAVTFTLCAGRIIDGAFTDNFEHDGHVASSDCSPQPFTQKHLRSETSPSLLVVSNVCIHLLSLTGGFTYGRGYD